MIKVMIIHENLSTIDPWLAPYSAQLQQRIDYAERVREKVLGDTDITDFSLGYLHFGLHQTSDGWVFREWAPNATKIYLVGEFSGWKDDERFALVATDHGQWEIVIPTGVLKHRDLYKLHIYWSDGDGYRIPAWATRTVQDETTHEFNAQVWTPPLPYEWKSDFVRPTDPPVIYEAHIGMSSQDEKVATYAEFTRDVLPRIIAGGYNTIQLMAIQEHPYYGSFGYHVSSFFAASSRFGTPEDLKALVDTAHAAGVAVVLDLVHSHAVKNEIEGLSRFDGSYTQYFHEGDRGNHEAWDSRVFDYGKPEVLHFLLSNCRYWLDEYHFDGYRFDGVTSMLYLDHGLEKSFTSYDDYFANTDPDALAYLTLANQLIHSIKPSALTIAEEMSGMPGIAGSMADGGIGFDYRLSMGMPDLWIKYIKELQDEEWQVSQLFHELSQHRPEEKTISYAESHDQALVGDKTLLFRLIDKDMYDHMTIGDQSLVVDRGVALHKMIRLLTASMHHGGYLNFMGNEFGHPEWIDFPREGNEWSYKYARRQWNLVDNDQLKYAQLGEFDAAMTRAVADTAGDYEWVTINDQDHVLAFTRGGQLFVYNFHPTNSYTDYGLIADAGDYRVIVSSDDQIYGGQGRIDASLVYPAVPVENPMLRLYLPARTAIVLQKID
ncbi:1,4-alpha-glucan branching protein [Candidatus Saccharibacteria bacterium RIFCSPHIGHO2_02_FULL_46_12]|nr:MAG: 1,4-alpha-glucan branching protein [Candidatus Saccharibacteria bacterium RIFCSPHIGHO2_02_FULL_46_12]OGL32165.1 MAG: 1,4-alpha-glucan branching protein [Candidatus Saccharibacteria bacterium RIFCSPHIGHO2_12_FULL_44_22]